MLCAFARNQAPEWRLRICGRFWENADRAITMSQPASCACCFSSPCTCERYPIRLMRFGLVVRLQIRIRFSGSTAMKVHVDHDERRVLLGLVQHVCFALDELDGRCPRVSRIR